MDDSGTLIVIDESDFYDVSNFHMILKTPDAIFTHFFTQNLLTKGRSRL